MSPHSSRITGSGEEGRRTCWTRSSMKWNSRHSLGGRRRFHAAASGGNRAGVGERLRDEQRDQQFALEPRLGVLVGVLGARAARATGSA